VRVEIRLGPWGRNPLTNPSATVPPPYGVGSLGIIVGSGTERIQFGNETDFAGVPLNSITTLKYWIFATSPSAPSSRLPSTWQQYDASAAGSKWYATNAATAAATGCTQTTPCSFSTLKAQLPNAVITLSLGINKGRDNPFVGAVDGVQVNNALYDFEPSGVRKFLL
jgi:hypothetical protein